MTFKDLVKQASLCFYHVFNQYKKPSFTHVYIVLYSATMLMIGPSTFMEDEDEVGDIIKVSNSLL